MYDTSYENHVTIFALGETFDPDAYLKQVSLEFDCVWRLGDPRGPATNGVEKILGEGRELSIFDQERIATEFLEQHEKELALLSRCPGIEAFVLGLQYREEATSGVCGFCLSLPRRLMYFALKAGVEPSFYVDLLRMDESIDFGS